MVLNPVFLMMIHSAKIFHMGNVGMINFCAVFKFIFIEWRISGFIPRKEAPC